MPEKRPVVDESKLSARQLVAACLERHGVDLAMELG
jgi:hypothetical protein